MPMLDLSCFDLRPTSGIEYHTNCPACNDTKGHLYVNLEKKVFYCHKCGYCGRIDDPGIYKNQDCLPKAEEEPADPSKLDRVYRLLFQYFNLSQEHKSQLIQRGLPEEKHVAYATMPGHGRKEVVNAIVEMVDPSGVPGFCLGEYGWYLSGPPGLLIPVKNYKGQIWGVQIRLDNPKSNNKYVWLSSKKGAGPKAKARYHVAKYGDTKRAWITEGPLKADIASYFLKETVIAVPGVNTWRSSGLIEGIKENDIQEAIIAYDADAVTNIEVAKAALRLGRELHRIGLKVLYAVWDTEYKGIDDLLATDKKPEIVGVKEYKRRLKPEGVKRYVNRVIIAGDIVNEPKIAQVNTKRGPIDIIRIILLTGHNGRKETMTLTGWGDVAKRATSLKKGQFIVAEGILQGMTAYDKVGSPIAAARINLTNFEIIAGNDNVG